MPKSSNRLDALFQNMGRFSSRTSALLAFLWTRAGGSTEALDAFCGTVLHAMTWFLAIGNRGGKGGWKTEDLPSSISLG